MNKQEYLRELENALRGKISPFDLDEIIRDYAEYFEEGKQQGKTEEEISKNLGIPFETARQILNAEKERRQNSYTAPNGFPQPPENRGYRRHQMTSLEVILLAVGILVLLPMALPLGAGLLGGLLGIFGGLLGLFGGLLGGAFDLIGGLFSWGTMGIFHHSSLLGQITGLLTGLGILAVMIGAVFGLCWAVKSLYDKNNEEYRDFNDTEQPKWKK